MSQQPTEPVQRHTESPFSFAATIAAALAAATAALIRPYLEASTENTVLVAMGLSVATTTSTAVYKAWVGKITSGNGGRRWISILFMGVLVGLAACLLGIGGVSGAELAMGKEPSISPQGKPIIPQLATNGGGPNPPTPPPPITPPPTPQEQVIQLASPSNAPSVKGTATFKDVSNGVQVTIRADILPGGPYSAHIHELQGGSCDISDAQDEFRHSLAPVTSNQSTTVIQNVTVANLFSGPSKWISVHANPNPHLVILCGTMT